MTDRTQLLDDLRTRFRDGATPSRLLQHILAVLGDSTSYRDLCSVVEDAFQLPVVRISPASVAQPHDHRGIVLNKTLLMEILQHRKEWDKAPSNGHFTQTSWLDDLAPRSAEELGSEIRADCVPGLSSESWAALRPEEREALHAQLIGGLVLSQRVEVLARLAERLQEKVCELERERSPVLLPETV